MVTFAKQGAEIFRDYATDGVPESGVHDPIKSDIRTWMATVEGFSPIEGLATVASAATTDIGADRAWQQVITGTTTITSFGSSAATGALKWLYFQDVVTLTHSSTLVCPNAADITTSAGSWVLVGYEGSNVWRVVSHRSGDGSLGIGLEPDSAWFDVTAGTSSKAPVRIRSGTNLTTPIAGGVEFDGKTLYFTPSASHRAVVPLEHIICLSADATGANSSTVQPVFPTGGTITVPSSMAYLMQAEYVITRSAGATSHTTAVSLGGTATFTSLRYTVYSKSGTSNVLLSGNRIYTTSASDLTVTSTSASSPEIIMLELSGVLRVNAGGTIIPQFKYSAAPGGVPTFLANSFFSLRPIGSNAVQSVGNWS